MPFKQLSASKAVIANTHTHIITRRIFAGLLAFLVLFATAGFERWSNDEVFIWSLVALLSWHFLFFRSYVEFDLDKQLITNHVSSLYSLSQQLIPIQNISAFQIRRRLGDSKGYELCIVLDSQIEPLKFDYGNLSHIKKTGQQLSQFCMVPLLSDVS
jgi:hypothetical protein